VELTPAQREAVESGVRAGLKDPGSAIFGSMAAAAGQHGQFVVCGYVNAKNSFGGYTGDQLFIAKRVDDVFVTLGTADDDFKVDAFTDECRFAGVQI